MKHSTKAQTDLYFENRKRAALIKAIVFFLIGTALILSLGSCNRAKQPVIDLPEEIEAITEDSANAVPMYGWRDKQGTIHIEYRNSKK